MTSRTSCAHAASESGGRRTSVDRACPTDAGKRSCTSGRERASTRRGLPRSLRSALSSSLIEAASPQWKILENQDHRLPFAPRAHRVLERQADLVGHRLGAVARGTKRHVPSSSKGTPTSSPRNAVTRAATSRGRSSATCRLQLLASKLGRLAARAVLRPGAPPARFARTASPRGRIATALQHLDGGHGGRAKARARTRGGGAISPPRRERSRARPSVRPVRRRRRRKSHTRDGNSRSRPTQEVGRPSSGRVGSSDSRSSAKRIVAPFAPEIESRRDERRAHVVDIDPGARLRLAHDAPRRGRSPRPLEGARP